MTKPKVALITGQDGSYLAELLLEKGYIVHGIKRRSNQFNTHRIDHLYQDPHIQNANFSLHYGDLADTSNLVRIDPRYFRPTEVDTLQGDPTKAKQKLGWVPEFTAHQMCQEMVASDLQEAQRLALLKANGYWVPVSAE